MACLHREDVKLRLSYNDSHFVCVVCLVECLTDKTKHVTERIEYGESCLNLLNQPITKYSNLGQNIQLFITAFGALWGKVFLIQFL